jgi:hypothetical protein
MNHGDVLAELRAWRDEFARAHGYDLHAMAAYLRELDCAAGQTVVRGEPRRPIEAKTPIQALQPNGAVISVSPCAKPLEAAPATDL